MRELRGGEKGFAGPITILAGPEALHCCGLLPEGSDAGRLQRALSRGAVVMIVPATDPAAEKRISVTLLKHSRDSVHIHDLEGGAEDNEP
jgi:hypothetical protein